jgi:hypothetical protein
MSPAQKQRYLDFLDIELARKTHELAMFDHDDEAFRRVQFALEELSIVAERQARQSFED